VVKRGDLATYEIRVESLRNQPHQQVAIEVQLPKNLSLESIRTKELRHKTANEETTIVFEPIQYFRANDVFSAVVQLKVEQASAGEIVAIVSSKGQPNPAIARLLVQPVN
jgi:RAB protein geranylgeranyltransferase component A